MTQYFPYLTRLSMKVGLFGFATLLGVMRADSQSLSPSYPSKEYIWLNGKVIAIENGNLLAPVHNLSFESGNLSSWIVANGSNASISPVLAHTGQYSIAMSGPVNAGVLQDIPNLIPGQQYLVSAWVYVTAGSVAGLYLDDTALATTTVNAEQGQTNGWQYISAPFTVDSTGKLRIHLWCWVGSGTIYFDDISVAQ